MMRHPFPLIASALFASLALGCKVPPETVAPLPGQGEDLTCGLREDGSRHFRVLHINDVYRIEGLLDDRGGLARLRTLRLQLEDGCDAVLLTHAGDALFPSLLSREYDGAQMIEALNALDGDTDSFDPRMLATFGNHEFDQSKCEDGPTLGAQVEDSQFAWLASNITWKDSCQSAADEAVAGIRSAKILPRQMLTLGGVEVGVFSLTTDTKVPDFVERIDDDYVAAAKAAVADLRGQGAELVLALTHLGAAEDATILAQLAGAAGPDLILGGHDHTAMTRDRDNVELGVGVQRAEDACSDAPAATPETSGDPAPLAGDEPVVFKGDADAATVRVIDVTLDAGGAVHWSAQSIALDQRYQEDPAVKQLIDARLDEHQKTFCAKQGEEPGCLEDALTTAGVTLVAAEAEIRRYETNLGSWVTDLMLASFTDDGAEIALVNSGGLRLNQDIPQGSAVDQQMIEELFAYPTPMLMLELDGATLQAVLNRSVEDWEGNGHWLQVGGLAYRHDVVAGTATHAAMLGADGPQAIVADKKYRVVTTEFLAAGNDGYTMLDVRNDGQDGLHIKAITAAAAGTDLKEEVIAALREAGPEGSIAPALAGWICSSDRPACPCLVPDP